MRTSHLGRAFALTLALPAAFGGTWAWLVHGGAIERALASERLQAEQAVARAADQLQADLVHAAGEPSRQLELDAARVVVGPFEHAPARAAAAPSVGLAEQAANARVVAGDAESATPFFARAAANGDLTAEGWLGYVDTLAPTDPEAASEQLAKARSLHRATWCGNLPFLLLAALREAAWAGHVAGWPRRDVLADEVFAAARTAPADVVPVVADELLAAWPELREDERLEDLSATAAVAVQLAGRAAPTTMQAGPGRSALVPIATGLAVVPARTCATLAARARETAARLHRPWTVVPIDDPAASPAPSLPVPALAETWTAVPSTALTSTLLTYGARLSLGLAIATLVLGNLLLWRLTRREHALVRLRSDFVDIVSHELRTPLAALSLKAEMLAAGDVPAGRLPHYLQGLHADVRRLNEQVARILDFGRLEQGAPLRRERIPARGLLARAVRAGRPALRLVQQQLDVDAERDLPAILGDVEVLGRALRNLLENAAKYAPPGSTVELRAYASGRHLLVEVADRGPGVPAAERRSVFQPFVRSSAAPAGVPGSGLGLALVAAAADAHGGSVEVAERSGGGAVFTIVLPIAEPGVAS
ncbi:MAG TPA: HAMP domain-containing sensor histidine kinase [Planctomycetota bacterium]|nr:HAMP domain-containing sensor histidine kinase [Planctomycetota bacterium]